jgi:hypothetical protein
MKNICTVNEKKVSTFFRNTVGTGCAPSACNTPVIENAVRNPLQLSRHCGLDPQSHCLNHDFIKIFRISRIKK